MGRFLDTVTFGPARRRRQMKKMLAELDRRDEIARLTGQDPLEAWDPPAQLIPLDPRRRRRRKVPARAPRREREAGERSKWTTVIIGVVVIGLVVISILNRNGALFGRKSPGTSPPTAPPTTAAAAAAAPDPSLGIWAVCPNQPEDFRQCPSGGNTALTGAR